MFRADGLVSAYEKIVDFTFTEGSREEIQTTVGEFTIPSLFKTKRSGLFLTCHFLYLTHCTVSCVRFMLLTHCDFSWPLLFTLFMSNFL